MRILRYASLALVGLPFQPSSFGQALPPLEPLASPTPVFMDSWTKPEAVRRQHVAPRGPREKLAPGPLVQLDAPDLAKILEEDALKADNGKGARRISIKRELPQTLEAGATPTEGAWRTLADGSSVWTATVESASALGLRLHFTDVILPAGASILVYNTENPDEPVSPYDAERLGKRTQFWSPTVFSPKVTIECALPPGVPPSAARFRIASLMHRYAGVDVEDKSVEKAGACNRDVTCFPDWQQTSRAVAGIGAIQDSGELFCTGCLLNDSAPADGTDYFLTANHCVTSQSEADDLEFYWFYQTSVCNGGAPHPSTVPRTSGGADLLAGASDSLRNDFTFLRLREATPGGVTYAGWSTASLSDNAPIVSVHHPDGDFKRISFGNRLAAESQYHRVQWTQGVTEPGSSGSPLFDAQKRVIGQLYGGVSACDNQQGSDTYGRFDRTYPLVQNWLQGQPVVVANDAFASASELNGLEGSVSGVSAGATRESGEPFHASNRGGFSIWYRWTAPEDSVMTFTTAGSGFDTLLAVYTGETVNALIPVASSDDGPEGITSALTFTAAGGTTYWVAVDGYNGIGGEVAVNWLPGVGGGLASNNDFADALVVSGLRGETVANNSGATREPGEPPHAGNPGGASLWFRWTAPSNGTIRFDTEGSAIDTLLAAYTGDAVDALDLLAESDDINTDEGIVSSRVSFNAQSGQVYFIAVDGYGFDDGVADQGVIRLAWAPPTAITGPVPANNAFAQAEEIAATSGSLTASNLRATKETGEPDHAGTDGGKSIWYRWTAPSSGLVTFDTLGSDFDTVLAVYTGTTVNNLTERGSTDDIDNTVLQSRVTVLVNAGMILRIAIDGYRTASGVTREGTVQLAWLFEAGAGGNDAFANAQALTGGSGEIVGDNSGATKESGEPAHADNRGGRSLWFRWIAPENGEVTFDTLGSTFDTLLAVYRGDAVNALTPVSSSDDIDTGRGILTSRVAFEAARGTEYRVAVDGFRSSESGAPPAEAGSVLLNWDQVKRPEVTLAEPRLDASGFHVSVQGGPGDQVTLQVSTGMSSWDSVTTATLGATGQVTMTDPNANSRDHAYYRVSYE